MNSQAQPQWIAIAAMAENRVIGAGEGLPWRILEEFQFFKNTTMGHVLLMGRKTWDTLPGALPGRETFVLSRSAAPGDLPGAQIIRSIDELSKLDLAGRKLFICGGAEIYRQTLRYCNELLISRVKKTPPGDAWMPVFEDLFKPIERLVDHPEFETIRWGRAGE